MPVKFESIKAGLIRTPVVPDAEDDLIHADRRDVDDSIETEGLFIVGVLDVVVHPPDSVEVRSEKFIIRIVLWLFMRTRHLHGLHDDVVKGSCAGNVEFPNSFLVC